MKVWNYKSYIKKKVEKQDGSFPNFKKMYEKPKDPLVLLKTE